jgi:putative Ca2+/H+ antiporter (TMEM165/GDT1 family)
VVTVAGWLEILVAAATLQLLVLPGEKVQMIIAGLATKYDPYVVTAGAGAAFAGWTALEVALGEALQGALPAVYLDAITGGLFLLFGVLLVYSATQVEQGGGPADVATDGGQSSDAERVDADTVDSRSDGGASATAATTGVAALDRYVPEKYRGFFPAFSVSAFGEFGDKTQLVTIGLAVQYGAHPAIWLGEMLVIIPISLLNALVFHTGVHRLTPRRRRYIYLASALLFFLFAADVAAAYWFGVDVLPV